ncbi:MAG: RIP metalloprotease RseP [Steroidobacteraceae bacterium]|jgi:regulator of sigma E protease|nr:RIP metalloprotease RseP [Steroidobacteraceae bacterium]
MMGTVFTSVLAFVVAIGVLVAVHEFGHFWVARRLGFKVLRFSIGFGRPLLKWTGRSPDRTEYVIAAIPLGGYVKMLDSREGPVEPGDEGRAFQDRPPLARIAVLLAGPGFNFLFALVAFWLVFMHGVPGLKPVIGEVRVGSIAEQAGLRPEDTVLSVAGRPVATREGALLGILDALVDGGNVPLVVSVEGGGERSLTLAVPPERRRDLTEPGALLGGLGFGFWLPRQPALVEALTEGGPAAVAGLEVGDEVVAVDGEPVGDFPAFVERIRLRPGQDALLTVRRDGGERDLRVAVAAESVDGVLVGRIGVTVGGNLRFPDDMRTFERYGPFAAVAPAAGETWSKTVLTVKFLWRMVTGDVSTKNISGPINIAQYAGLSALGGIGYFLGFLALVSISLGVLNLLPIPILDGGQVLYQLAEIVKGRPLSEEMQVAGQKAGVVLLVALMGFAFYNDIARLIG